MGRPHLKWRLLRRTKQGRKVEEATAVRWSSAKSGITPWLTRNRVSDKIGTLDPKRYSYQIEIDFRFQFPGRKIQQGTLDITPDSKHLTKRIDPHFFMGTKGFRKGLRFGAWAIYREIIRSLLLGNHAQLPAYTKKIGKKKGFRVYRKLELRVRIIRTQRAKPKGWGGK